MKKFLLILLKIVPMVGALCCALNGILSYFYLDMVWLGYVMHGMMMLTWIALAIYFKFCVFYMLLVLYFLACETINTIDYIFHIPISNWGMFVVYCSLTGVLIISATIAHVKHTKRNKKHIGELG